MSHMTKKRLLYHLQSLKIRLEPLMNEYNNNNKEFFNKAKITEITVYKKGLLFIDFSELYSFVVFGYKDAFIITWHEHVKYDDEKHLHVNQPVGCISATSEDMVYEILFNMISANVNPKKHSWTKQDLFRL